MVTRVERTRWAALPEAKLGAAEDAIVEDVPGRDLRLRVQFYVASYDFLLQAASGGGGKH